MTNTIPQDDRAAFEAWYQDKFIKNSDAQLLQAMFELRIDGKYSAVHVDGAWEGWQAALAHERQRNQSAKQKYDEIMVMGNEVETSPLERLRFFLSLALSGQDWLDAEPFINDLTKAQRNISVEAMAGWKLVPIEPTDGMIASGAVARDIGNVPDIYKAMLSAAPPAPALSELKKVYDGVLARKAARGFTVPDDIHHLLKAIRALVQDTKEG